MTGERELTGALRSFFGSSRGVLVPLGDDAAVVRSPKGGLVLCCDPVVEGVHFLADTPLSLVGRKAVNRNLSDLAAMGAAARWLLCSVVAPKDFGRARLLKVLGGVRGCAENIGAVQVPDAVQAAPALVRARRENRVPVPCLQSYGHAHRSSRPATQRTRNSGALP